MRHLDEEYFSTRPDMMKALLCGAYTLIQVIRIIVDTEREISRRRKENGNHGRPHRT
jgi:hypothetical protein